MPRPKRSGPVDGPAFRRVYEACYPDVTALVRRRVHANDVEDVVSEVFTVVWRRWEAVPKGDEALPWIYAVARRVISEHYRAGSRRQRLLERVEDFTRTAPRADPSLETVTDDRVRSVLEQMRPADREILRLSAWEDLSVAEIAEVIGKPARVVSVRLFRARQRFQAVWNETAEATDEPPFAEEAP